MMERSLIGLDIMPAATHLTCSMLSGAYPSASYARSQIHTMPYGIGLGRRRTRQVSLGALSLWFP